MSKNRWLVLALLFASMHTSSVQAQTSLPVSISTTSVFWEDLDTSFANGFFISDASLGSSGLTHAYDNAFTLRVNNAVYSPVGAVTLSTVSVAGEDVGTLASGAAKALSGFNTSQNYLFYHNFPLVRIEAVLENISGSALTLPVDIFGDLGSNALTTIVATSSTDTTVTTDDRWVITGGHPSVPVHTFVVQGVGGEPSSDLIFSSDDFLSTHSVTIPAGETRRLFWFAALSASESVAQTDVTLFDTNLALESAGLVCDLSQAVLDEVVNWSNLVACQSLTGRVWNDENQNGLRVDTEVGVGGVQVSLVRVSDTESVQITTTEADGTYLFANVLPDVYRVLVQIPSLSSLEFSLQNQGGDETRDSDVNPTTGESANFTVGLGFNTSFDAGLVIPNLVDTDSDGFPDVIELAVGTDPFDAGDVPVSSASVSDPTPPDTTPSDIGDDSGVDSSGSETTNGASSGGGCSLVR